MSFPASDIVDWRPDAENVNMYGCRPCPKCNEPYRYAHHENGERVICCDDCGYREPVKEWIE